MGSLAQLYSECARLAGGRGGAGALASVARRRGSLPMSASAKMLVTLDGARIGTVGGGCLEAEIIERALSAAERGVPAVSEHTLANELAGDYGLTCGGTATIVVEPVHRSSELAACYAACAELLARDGRGVLVTALDWSTGIKKALVTTDARWLPAGCRSINPAPIEPLASPVAMPCRNLATKSTATVSAARKTAHPAALKAIAATITGRRPR